VGPSDGFMRGFLYFLPIDGSEDESFLEIMFELVLALSEEDGIL